MSESLTTQIRSVIPVSYKDCYSVVFINTTKINMIVRLVIDYIRVQRSSLESDITLQKLSALYISTFKISSSLWRNINHHSFMDIPCEWNNPK